MEKLIQTLQDNEKDGEENTSLPTWKTGIEIKENLPLLNETSYYLNKSKSKLVSVGLCPIDLTPQLRLTGPKCDCVSFRCEEWANLVLQKDIIKANFYSPEGQPVIVSCKSVTFPVLQQNQRVIRICDHYDNKEVWLGFESICQLLELSSVIQLRLRMLQEIKFNQFYNCLIEGLSRLSGDLPQNVKTVVESLNTDKALCVAELQLFQPNRIVSDVELLKNKNL